MNTSIWNDKIIGLFGMPIPILQNSSDIPLVWHAEVWDNWRDIWAVSFSFFTLLHLLGVGGQVGRKAPQSFSL